MAGQTIATDADTPSLVGVQPGTGKPDGAGGISKGKARAVRRKAGSMMLLSVAGVCRCLLPVVWGAA